jgi:hypothetical protein
MSMAHSQPTNSGYAATYQFLRRWPKYQPTTKNYSLDCPSVDLRSSNLSPCDDVSSTYSISEPPAGDIKITHFPCPKTHSDLLFLLTILGK